MKLIPTSGFAGVRITRGLTRGWLAPTLLLLMLAALAFALRNPRPASGHDLCPNTGSPLGPFNMETYEAHRQTYGRAFELAANNQLLQDVPGFALPAMETGPRAAGSSQMRPGYIPPALLKAIAWIEASWSQADYSVAYGSAGPTLISHDCGYGVMQVTSGMQNVTGMPTTNQAMIGGHYAFNIARGAQILIDKWNGAPEYRPIVGSRDPGLIEDWYYAVWSYNGFSYKNHPANPAYPANRLPYSCGPTNDGFGHNRTQYPYQELVFGCMARPPIVAGAPLWTPQPVYLATPGHPVFSGALSSGSWDTCAYSLACTAMDMPTPIPNNRDGTPLTLTRAQVIGSPVLSLSSQNLQMIAVPPAQQGIASLTVANAGTGVLSYRITSNVPWLRTSRYQGVALGADLGARQSTLTITTDTSGLGSGRYAGTLTIESPLAANAPANVTVVVDNFPQGTLLKGSGPEIYLMWGGLRRHVPNMQTLEAHGISSGVITITDPALNAITQGNPLPSALADGNLFIGSGPSIWVMQGGSKRHIANEGAMSACQYGSDSVRRLSDATLNGIPNGPTLAGAPCPRLAPSDGSMIRGTGPEVFIMRGGLKRHVPNMLTFEGLGLRWGNLDSLGNSQVNAVPTGNQLLDLQTTGILLQGVGPEVYVMQNGARRHVATEQVFNGCGYAWSAIYHVSHGTLGNIPFGAPVTDTACPRFDPPEGRLLRGDGPEVFLVQGGLKRHIPNSPTLNGLGFKFGNVDVMNTVYVGALVTGAPVLDVLSNGNLLKGPGPEVYVMQDGARRHVVNEATFTACGYSWGAVYGVPAFDLPLVPAGAPLSAAPCPQLTLKAGALVRSPDQAVYVGDGQSKRHITSGDAFGACNYHWGNVDLLRDAVINEIATGPQLSAPPCP